MCRGEAVAVVRAERLKFAPPGGVPPSLLHPTELHTRNTKIDNIDTTKTASTGTYSSAPLYCVYVAQGDGFGG